MRWTIVILAIFLSGCVATYSARYQSPPPLQSTSLAQVDAMAGGQQPVAYKVGFRDGCDSGRVSAGNTSFIFKKDVVRFDEDSLYQQGWTDGYNRCFAEGGIAGGGTSVSTTYGWGYYPGYFYSGYYYPSWGYYCYYEPGYSIWLGNYGHRHSYTHHDHYYYTPWYGGHRHGRGHSHKSYSKLNPYIYRGGSNTDSYIQQRSYSGSPGPYIQKRNHGGRSGPVYKGKGHGGGRKKGGPMKFRGKSR